jgi:hypothetical protein
MTMLRGDGPAEPEQLPKVFAEEGAAELVLGEPGSRQRSAVCRIPLLANQVHTKLGPPAANLVSTTLAGSRSISGQSNVADK